MSEMVLVKSRTVYICRGDHGWHFGLLRWKVLGRKIFRPYEKSLLGKKKFSPVL